MAPSGVTYVTVTDPRTKQIVQVPVDDTTGLIVTTLPTLDAFGHPVPVPRPLVGLGVGSLLGVGSTGAAIGTPGIVAGTENLFPVNPAVSSPFGPQMGAFDPVAGTSAAVSGPIGVVGRFGTGRAFGVGTFTGTSVTFKTRRSAFAVRRAR